MKQVLLFLLLLFTRNCFGQTSVETVKSLHTFKYAGFYGYGTSVEKGAVGSIVIYPETDSSILFYLSLNCGAPSYNGGRLYGRLNIKNDKGIFYIKKDYTDEGCKLSFSFINTKSKINVLDYQ